MPKKCCANCFFFVKLFSRDSDGKLQLRKIAEGERDDFKNLDLEKLDNSYSYKCWKGIWQEISYPNDEFVDSIILKDRSRILWDDECYFLNRENKNLTFKAADEKVQKRKENLKINLQLFLTLLIVLTGIVSIIIMVYG